MSDLSVRELPDVEGLLIRVLGADEDLRNAGLRRVVGPAWPRKENLVWPLIHVHRFGGASEFAPWLDVGNYDVNVWGDSDTVKLRSIYLKAFAALVRLPGVYDEGVVSSVKDLGRGFLEAPDTRRARYLIRVEVRAHPNP